ncbi:hypothetical protein HK096_006289 [Nowakowskiella sp. JEL0078]|nr:hypothetical protein HK096_006289 [Nowakowskiella sp. JEL0078]
MDRIVSKKGKLTFKGEPVEKKKKKKRPVEDSNKNSEEFSFPEEERNWIISNDPDDFVGPMFLISMAIDPPSCLSSHESSTRAFFKPLPDTQTDEELSKPQKIKKKYADEDEDETEEQRYDTAKILAMAEPIEVSTVMIGKRLVGYEDPSTFNVKNDKPAETNWKISLCSAFDKFLTCDKFGGVSFDREAVGPTEEFDILVRPDGIALKNTYGKFLKVENGGILRFDSETVGSRETFRVKVQIQNKKKKKTKKEEEAMTNVGQIEIDQIKRFHAAKNGIWTFVEESTRELKHAKNEGKLNETLLDRREKIKSDKFCK